MKRVKITIVGSGHGGSAAAACMSKAGHDVTILKLSHQSDPHFEKLQDTLDIKLAGMEGEGTFPLECATRNPAEAIPQADIILVYYVSNYHAKLANALAPYLRQAQTVYICPGYLGSLLFLNEMQRIGRGKAAPLFVEGETLPYSCRIAAPGAVKIYARNHGHPIATLPAYRAQEACKVLEPVLKSPIPRDNVVEVALHNPNLIMHTVGIAMNAAYIENSDGKFSMYTKGFTPSTWKIAHELDAEKQSILKKLQSAPRSYIEEFKVRTFTDPESYSDEKAFDIYAESVSDLYTDTVKNRYITEDVPMGLGLLHSLGQHLGVPTPVADSIIIMSGVMVGSNYFQEARTIESLGFGNISSFMRAIGIHHPQALAQSQETARMPG